MKITQATYRTERLALTRPYTIAYDHIDSVQNFFVQLKTDDGAYGMGVASPAEEVTGEGVQKCRQTLAENLENLLLGADIRYLKTRLRDMESAMPGAPAARAAIDMALHDLWAKHHGLPLVDLLGRVHHSLPTSITIGIGSVEESLEDGVLPQLVLPFGRLHLAHVQLLLELAARCSCQDQHDGEKRKDDPSHEASPHGLRHYTQRKGRGQGQ